MSLIKDPSGETTLVTIRIKKYELAECLRRIPPEGTLQDALYHAFSFGHFAAYRLAEDERRLLDRLVDEWRSPYRRPNDARLIGRTDEDLVDEYFGVSATSRRLSTRLIRSRTLKSMNTLETSERVKTAQAPPSPIELLSPPSEALGDDPALLREALEGKPAPPPRLENASRLDLRPLAVRHEQHDRRPRLRGQDVHRGTLTASGGRGGRTGTSTRCGVRYPVLASCAWAITSLMWK